jgi:hypothetical protein
LFCLAGQSGEIGGERAADLHAGAFASETRTAASIGNLGRGAFTLPITNNPLKIAVYDHQCRKFHMQPMVFSGYM